MTLAISSFVSAVSSPLPSSLAINSLTKDAFGARLIKLVASSSCVDSTASMSSSASASDI